MQHSKIIFSPFLLLLFLIVNTNFAQKNGSQWLIGDSENYYMHPVWAPDGSKIAFTESNYNGLWVMNPDGSNAVQISDEAASGWGFEWSADSKSILSRVAKFVGPRRLNAVKYFDIETGDSNQLTEYKSFMPGLPHWIDFDQNILIFNKKRPDKIKTNKTLDGLDKSDFRQSTCFLKGNKLAIYNNNTFEINSLDPLNASGYLNPVISNDGNKIAFEEYGGNLYVMDLDGTNLVDLGIGYFPQWSPNSKNIVYMLTEDDGHRITYSDIYMVNIENLVKVNITNTSEKLEMHPNWSPDGKTIVFDESHSGSIYLLEL
jgi:Tol biopolymer transport system component